MLHKSNTGGVLFLNVKPESEVARKAQIIGERMHHLCRILVPPEILSDEEFNKHLTVAVVISIDIANHLGIDGGHARQMAIDNHGATVILMEPHKERQKAPKGKESANLRIYLDDAVERINVILDKRLAPNPFSVNKEISVHAHTSLKRAR